MLEAISVDGCVTKAPGGGQGAGRSPVDWGKQGMKGSSILDEPSGNSRNRVSGRTGTAHRGPWYPAGSVLAGANRHDSPLLAPTLDKLDDLGSLPDNVTIHVDAGYDSDITRITLPNANCSAR